MAFEGLKLGYPNTTAFILDKKKIMCVSSDMSKTIGVGRLEKSFFFILKKS